MNAKWLGIAWRILPLIGGIVLAIEQVKTLRGEARLQAAKAALMMALQASEAGVDRDLLDDAEVQKGLDGIINAAVAFENAYANAKAKRTQ
jgi:hypothetical protein